LRNRRNQSGIDSINGKARATLVRRFLLPARYLRQMQTRLVKITNRLGLHARACAKVVQVASRFRCTVSLVWNGRRASARSMLAVMLLAAGVGATIRVETSGPDETEAMTAMVQLIAGQFDEER
jgi:phosphocarrier protein